MLSHSTVLFARSVEVRIWFEPKSKVLRNIFSQKPPVGCARISSALRRCTNTVSRSSSCCVFFSRCLRCDYDDVDDIQRICDLGNENAFLLLFLFPLFFASLRSRTDASSWVTCINITPNCRREKKVFSREIKQHEKSSAFENINCTFNYAYGGPDCTWRCLRMHTATYEEKTVWSLFRSATTQSAARYDLRSFFSTAPSSRGELN